MDASEVVRRLVRAEARTVLVDGRSGAGKTTFAAALQALWEDSAVVHLDDVYPGWGGLSAGVEHVHDALLAPRRAHRGGRWRRWDWSRESPAEWHDVAPDRPLIVEGSGALTPENRALADLGIWIECADDTRKRRALRRDGATFAAQWDRWAAQECAHIAHHDPRSVADLVVRG
ncbi:hypothetical protein [Mycolicibacterium sp. 050158]|uniref:hypothetical protein n=1 Tax=Mycolicibacterium sp. 050158 TaxID=3090602 RepID=UPI00299F1968|nr:hypothetical protein [Mycolicibacterium sp. 050158]MDX1891982.1 hypothetical protein [Mycolicibacterium sp. 050158]